MGPPDVRLYAVLRPWVAKATAAPWTGRVAHHEAAARGHRSSSALNRHFEAEFDSYMRHHEKAREPKLGSDCIRRSFETFQDVYKRTVKFDDDGQLSS